MYNKARGGTAIFIRDSIKHYEREKFIKEYLQPAAIEEDHGPITMSAIYYPHKHHNKKEHFQRFYKT